MNHASPPEFYAQSSLPRLAHSALPNAPVVPHNVRQRRRPAEITRIVRRHRRGGGAR